MMARSVLSSLSSVAEFLEMWDAPHWWNFMVGWMGRDGLKI
jgi:hypothetical protein